MICPRCDSEVWDNRPKKASGQFKPNSPDFTCKDKECGWKQWPDKAGGQEPAAKTSSPATAAPADSKREKLAAILDTGGICLDRASEDWATRYEETTPKEILEWARCMLLIAERQGALVRRKKQEKFSEKPKAIQEHEDELQRLPF